MVPQAPRCDQRATLQLGIDWRRDRPSLASVGRGSIGRGAARPARLMRPFLIVVEGAGSNLSAYSPDLPGCVATGATLQETKASRVEHQVDQLAADRHNDALRAEVADLRTRVDLLQLQVRDLEGAV